MAFPQGCKNTLGITSLLRGIARDLEVPIGIINMDCIDSRVVSVEGISTQIGTFIDTLEGRPGGRGSSSNERAPRRSESEAPAKFAGFRS